MKRVFFSGILFIILGFILGNFIFTNKKIIFKDNCYFIQEGVYSSKDNISNLEDLENKIIDYQDNKYYVYIGITKDRKIAERIRDIYNSYGINTFIKKKRINSNKFLNNLEEFDTLISNSTSEKEILTIEDIILKNYLQIKNSSKT